jgi:hypothetical protein
MNRASVYVWKTLPHPGPLPSTLRSVVARWFSAGLYNACAHKHNGMRGATEDGLGEGE